MIAIFEQKILKHIEFEYFRSLLFQKAGISLSDKKVDLVQARLRKRLLALNLQSYEEYARYLQTCGANHSEWQEFINLLTTNKTEWFREIQHFEYLSDQYLPEWKRQNKKPLMVWCAASSTGEEAYSLSMVMHRHLGSDYKIIASDIDTQVLNYAQNAVYPIQELNKIPDIYQAHSIMKGTSEIASWFKVHPRIAEKVEFRQFNLNDPDYQWPYKFDLIFCRNVMIYFSKEVIAHVLENFYKVSGPEALLVISHSEALPDVKTNWNFHGSSIYGKKAGARLIRRQRTG